MDPAAKLQELATLDERIASKKSELADLNDQVNRLREQAREYELGMRYTRTEDAKRTETLDHKEVELKARERRLTQDKADFEKRKRRWQQLKDISR